MKTVKLNFSKIENTLTRDEMKNIMAGSAEKCKPNFECRFGCEALQPGGGYLCSTCCVA